MRNVNRFGLGESILSRGAAVNFSHGMRAGEVAAPDWSQKISQAQKDFEAQYPGATKAIKNAGSGSVSSTVGATGDIAISIGTGMVLANPLVGGALIAAGLLTTAIAANWDDWGGSMKAEDKFPRVANSYIDHAWDIADLLGCGSRGNKTKEGWRVYLRLGELVAKLNPDIKKYGWHYGGPRNNDPNTEEGKDFRTSYGTTNKLIGIESRWESSDAEEVFTFGMATGRAGKRLKILRSATETLARIKFALELLPTPAERKAAFAGMLQKWVKEKTLDGMSFLGTPAPVSEFIAALMAAPYGKKISPVAAPAAAAGLIPAKSEQVASKKTDPAGAKAKLEATKAALLQAKAEADAKKTQSTQANQGSGGKGGLVALLAAAGGAYFLLKG